MEETKKAKTTNDTTKKIVENKMQRRSEKYEKDELLEKKDAKDVI